MHQTPIRNFLMLFAITVVSLDVPIVIDGVEAFSGRLTTINLDLSPLISISFNLKKLFEMSIICYKLDLLWPIHNVSSANARPAILLLITRSLLRSAVGYFTEIV